MACARYDTIHFWPCDKLARRVTFRFGRRANQWPISARLIQLRGERDLHERAVRCGGRRGRAREELNK